MPIPPLAEQRAIADFLDHETSRIDVLIAKRQRIIGLLDEKRSALITQAVTKGLDPTAPMRDSGIEWIGEIPEGWDVAPVKRAYEVMLGKMLQTVPKSSADRLSPYLKASNIGAQELETAVFDEMYFTPMEMERLLLRPKDVLVIEGGATAGLSVCVGDLGAGLPFQNSINRVRPRSDFSPRYLFHYLKLIYQLGIVELLCNRSTFTHFTKDKLEAVEIPLPPPARQRAIADFLDRETSRIDQLKSLNQRQIELLKEKRQALITAAVTGKIPEARGVA